MTFVILFLEERLWSVPFWIIMMLIRTIVCYNSLLELDLIVIEECSPVDDPICTIRNI